MTLERLIKKVRLSIARLPAVGYGHLPEAPVYILRDLWQGDSVHGMHLIKGEYIYQDCILPLYPGEWGGKTLSREIQQNIHNFSWLRDMRELGTENARLVARSLVLDWISNAPSEYDKAIYQPATLATRVTNWVGHYDFFAASADHYFHQQLIHRIMIEGRYMVAMLPLDSGTHEVFTVLKGAMVLALTMPEQFDLVPKLSKYLQYELVNQILEEGVHIERNPEFQLYVLRDLVEIRLMYQLINVYPPTELITALDTVSRSLRALRHGDGKLALFNGACENNTDFIDRVLSHSTQKRVAMTDMKQGGYIRCYANRSTLLIDSGQPAEKGNYLKHLGALSFEFSVGKQRLIVNCGSGGSSAWRSALAGTAAHSVLKLGNVDCVAMHDNQKVDPDFKIESMHEMKDGAHWVELSHNGWQKPYGAFYVRQLYLSADGNDLRGEDVLEMDSSCPFAIRFHLHPQVRVEEKNVQITEEKNETLFVLSFHHHQEGDQVWWFRFSGAKGCIEESVYFGQSVRLATKQIVLYSFDQFEKPEPTETIKTQHSVDQEQQQPLATSATKEEESSAYVAIFHHQDHDAEIRQENLSPIVSAGMSEAMSEKDAGIQETFLKDNTDKVSENESVEGGGKTCSQEDSDVKNEREQGKVMVRWALRRKV